MARLRPHLVVAGSCLMVVVGCGSPNQYQPPPRPKVTVAQPVRKTVTTYLVETGTTEPVEEVEVRARVKGFIDEVKFEAGTMVEKGTYQGQVRHLGTVFSVMETSWMLPLSSCARSRAILRCPRRSRGIPREPRARHVAASPVTLISRALP